MILPENFKKKVLQFAKEIGVEPKEIHLREMTRKWASCSSKGRLTFSTKLLKKPLEMRDKVIIHELLHLKYPNHGKMFKALLNTYLEKSLKDCGKK
jgi:predicted metal-dependent hydrolase